MPTQIIMAPPPGAPAVNSITGQPINGEKTEKPPIKVRKLTPKELERYIHYIQELVKITPYFAPILRQLRPAIINTDKAYIDKHWRIALPEGSLDDYLDFETFTKIMREALRIVIIQRERAARAGYRDDETARASFDLEINQRLSGLGGRIKLDPENDFVPADYDLPPFGIAEEFYDTILQYFEEEEPPSFGGNSTDSSNGQQGGKSTNGGGNGTPSSSNGNSGSGTASKGGSSSSQEEGDDNQEDSNEENPDNGDNTESGNGNGDGEDSQGDESQDSGNGTPSDTSDEEGNGGGGGSDTEEDGEEDGSGGITDEFVTNHNLQALMDGAGIQAASEMVKRESRKDMLAKVRQEQAKKSRGKGHNESILDWVTKTEAGNTVHWTALLKRTLATASSQRTAGETYRTFRKYNRLNVIMPDNRVMFPTYYDTKPHVYVGVDTSGSMLNEVDSGRALGNIDRILNDFRNRAEMRICAIDTKMGEFQNVRDISEINFVGGGGTEMAPFVKALNEYDKGTDSKHPPAALGILITDGYIDWKAVARELGQRHNYKLAIVLTSDHNRNSVAEMNNYFSHLPLNARPTIIKIEHPRSNF